MDERLEGQAVWLEGGDLVTVIVVIVAVPVDEDVDGYRVAQVVDPGLAGGGAQPGRGGEPGERVVHPGHGQPDAESGDEERVTARCWT